LQGGIVAWDESYTDGDVVAIYERDIVEYLGAIDSAGKIKLS
jgi:hypothetical protein